MILHFFLMVSLFSQAKGADVSNENPLTHFFADLESFQVKSLSLDSQKQQLESDSARLQSRRLFWTPTVNAGVSKGFSHTNTTEPDSPARMNLQVDFNVFKAGKDSSELAASEAQKKAQEFEVLNEELRIELMASDLLFKNIFLSEKARITEAIVKLKEESLTIVSNRFKQGKLPLQEITKAKVDLNQQRGKLRTAQLAVLKNKSEMAAEFVEEIRIKNWPFSEQFFPKRPSIPPLETPNLKRQFWLTQFSEESWKSMKSLYYPTMDFRIEYEQTLQNESSPQSNGQWTGLLMVTLPLWNQFQTSSVVAQGFANYMKTSNEEKNAVQKQIHKYHFLQEQIKVTRTNLEEAHKNLSLARNLYQEILVGFRLGRVSMNDLFVEQNRLLETETELALSQLLFHQSLMDFCALIGQKARTCF